MRIIGKIKLYNGHFREARIKAGFRTLKKLSDFTGIAANTLCSYEGLKSIPGKQKNIELLEQALRKGVQELFPQDACLAIKKNLGRVFWFKKEVNIATLPWANPNLIEYKPFEEDAKQAIKDALNTLPEKERKIIELRYLHNMTLEEVGQIFKNSKERIRQIEAKGLKLLRHPERSNFLREIE